jgi:PAS domain-containing protein
VVLGRNCRLLQGEDTEPDRVARLRTAVHEATPCTVELRNYRADGTALRNRVTVAPVHDDDWRVVTFVGFQEAVSEPDGG